MGLLKILPSCARICGGGYLRWWGVCGARDTCLADSNQRGQAWGLLLRDTAWPFVLYLPFRHSSQTFAIFRGLHFKLAGWVPCWTPLGSHRVRPPLLSGTWRLPHTARLPSSGSCRLTALFLWTEVLYVTSGPKHFIFRRHPSSLLLGRSELGSLCWDDRRPSILDS